jgi:hypothetical protein
LHLIANDQLLRNRAGLYGISPGEISENDFNLLAGDCFAMFLLENLDGLNPAVAENGDRPGKRRDEADFDRLLSVRRDCECDSRGGQQR